MASCTRSSCCPRFEKLIERDDYFAMLFTAVVHDVGHTGRNNVHLASSLPATFGEILQAGR